MENSGPSGQPDALTMALKAGLDLVGLNHDVSLGPQQLSR